MNIKVVQQKAQDLMETLAQLEEFARDLKDSGAPKDVISAASYLENSAQDFFIEVETVVFNEVNEHFYS